MEKVWILTVEDGGRLTVKVCSSQEVCEQVLHTYVKNHWKPRSTAPVPDSPKSAINLYFNVLRQGKATYTIQLKDLIGEEDTEEVREGYRNFRVEIPEVHISTRLLKIPEEELKGVEDLDQVIFERVGEEGREVNLEYNRTLEPEDDPWGIEEITS